MKSVPQGEIDDLFWKDFCDNYIELVKSRLYEPELHGVPERRSGQAALYYTLLNILKMYAIYIPHITDYIYTEFFRKHEKEISIHLSQWVNPQGVDAALLKFGEEVKDSLAGMRKYKSEQNLSMRAEMEELTIECGAQSLDWFKQTEMDLQTCANAKEIKYIIRNP